MDLKNCFLFAALTVAHAVVATPSVEDVSMVQAQDSCLITVSYTLGGEPAVVTFGIQTNRTGAATLADADWLSVGEQVLTNAVGDVNCLVSTGARRILWRADDTWDGNLVAQGAARAVVKAWSTNTPPDYLVVDLRRDSDRRYSPEPRVRYFTSTNALPHGGISSDAYRNEYIAMRRIPSQGVKWCMGSAETEVARVGNETQHYVTFTNADFYMAVFPLTRGQALNFGTLAMGDQYGLIDVKLSSGTWLYQYINCYDTTNEAPVCVQSTGAARGSGDGVDWPSTGHAVSAGSVCGLMRERTGVDFDLPTDAQWEFAYRAGTSSAYHDGSSPVAQYDFAGVRDIGWIDSNSTISGVYYLRRVGLKKPNAWGLYDMSGSVFEWCLDYHASTMAADSVLEPTGPDSGTARIVRGGCYKYSYTYARAAAKTKSDNSTNQSSGVRLICPVTLIWP